ncbi:A3(2) glycogen metabolism cluster I [Renibacterium salmoninarum ATCC 33209]|uniref:A3(2) glycogen metabolism cluster I n=1 Tax=Renibacterium salmoninarum (strain ATCC 33209 / DSM 20767 / JCM 11484 / NBRC 15589 / NCIMB 2235) TaxID=288705 RepID=A9WV68_RENSM|nr:DUF1990 domain-containing protein [Renibacterium salmoninarum]ABY25089.1 A3(2) glycogen metabolism cluster I [Renibacterium salmoninarum ATCC 33209]
MGELTYPQIGLSRQLFENGPESAAGWPAGSRRVFERILIGHGVEAFNRLTDGILDWQIQRKAGLRPRSATRAVPGAQVVCSFGLGPLRLSVPCEVVWSEQGASVGGFGYGTLPGHPARGEEAFIAQLADDGAVWFSVLAFSKPSPGIFAMTAPASRFMQARVTRKYLAAAKAIVG